jgi:hypothetical protein
MRIANTYKAFVDGSLADEKGFCAVVDIAKIAEQDYILTPGRYVGIAEQEQDAEPFEAKMQRLTGELATLFEQSHTLEAEIKKHERALASVTIITDGYENASTEYNAQQIHQLIGRLKEQEGWNFAFMGANQDVTKVSVELNIDVQNTREFEFSCTGARDAFDAYNEGNMCFFSAVENCDREVGDDVSEKDRRKRRRQMMASRSFFRHDED